jgi:hypothetical protein
MVKKFKNTARPEGYSGYLSRGGKWLKFGKNTNKYLIILVGAIMVFSGLYSGVNREIPSPTSADNPGNWTSVNYDSASLYASGVLAQVEGASNTYKMIPKSAGLLQSGNLDIVFESNVTGVQGITLENAPGYVMFSIETDGRNVTAEIRKRIRLPGDYNLYRVYNCRTQYGLMEVVGDNFEKGDYVKVLVLGRTRAGSTQLLGFAQNKMVVGPEVKALVLSVESLQVAGVTSDASLGVKLDGTLNLTDFRTQRLLENSSDWEFTFNLPPDYAEGKVLGLAGGYNLTNVTMALVGFTQVPQEMVVQDKIMTVPQGGVVPTTFKSGVKVNDTIDVKVYTMKIGNNSVAFAIGSSGNGTGVQ